MFGWCHRLHCCDCSELGEDGRIVPCAAVQAEGLVSLRTIAPGQKVRIARVQACGELGRRIRDMGLIPGVDIEVIGRAPLRDPVALRLPGFTLSLRNNEADHIFVQPVEE